MNLTSNAPEDYLGSTIGGYTLTRVLGTGSTGIVFLGEHPERLTENVAIKICIPPLQFTAEEREVFQARFLRESEVVQRLHHPHIVPVLQRGTENGVLYTVFYYMQGGTLAERLSHHPQGMDFAEINHILTQIAGALDTAHTLGLVHRDVKPTNIFFDQPEIFSQQDNFSQFDEAYLGDFGIVHLFSQARITLTAQGQVLGTPEYMAPEQANGDLVTPAADIYGLGVVVYELVTGHLPFTGTTPLHLLLQVAQSSAPPPRQWRDDLPPAAEAAILRALAKDPARRFASAGEFAAAFLQATSGSGTMPDVALTKATLATPIPPLFTPLSEERPLRDDTASRLKALSHEMPAIVTRPHATSGPSSVDIATAAAPAVALPPPPRSVFMRLTAENIIVLVVALLITTIGTLVILGQRTVPPHRPLAAATTTPLLTATTAVDGTSTPSSATTPPPEVTTTSAPAPGATKPPVVVPPAQPGQPTATPTATPGPQPILLFDFENGAVWQKLGPQITGVVTSTDHATDGTHSLEIKFTNVTTTTYPETFTNQAEHIANATILTMQVYLPSGIGGINAQSFVVLSNSAFYGSGYIPLAQGTWTTLRFPLPSQTFGQTAVNLGMQFYASGGSVNGSIYIDHVQFVFA